MSNLRLLSIHSPLDGSDRCPWRETSPEGSPKKLCSTSANPYAGLLFDGGEAMSDGRALELLLVGGVIFFGYWWFWSPRRRDKLEPVRHGEKSFGVTQTSTMFVPYLERYIDAGAEITLPTGDGLYPSRLKPALSKEYKESLARWVS